MIFAPAYQQVSKIATSCRTIHSGFPASIDYYYGARTGGGASLRLRHDKDGSNMAQDRRSSSAPDDPDATFRAAAANSGSVVRSLSNLSNSDLYAALAYHSALIAEGRAVPAAIDADDLPREASYQRIGRILFRRWNCTLHDFVCKSEGEDQQLREKLAAALTGKEGGAAALVAGILVSSFGVSPVLAAIIGTLLIRIIVAPAVDELCSYWTSSLRST
jgi:hypothetical protein